MRLPCVLVACVAVGCATRTQPEVVAAPDTAPSAVDAIVADATAVAGWLKTPLARAFVATATELPRVERRVVYLSSDHKRAYDQAQASALQDAERSRLIRKELDEEYYYFTRYGTPVSYARALEVLGEHGVATLAGAKVLDFGYGYIGHLRMFALMGADATGIDVDPVLPVLYSAPGDTGPVVARSGQSGRVRLVSGRFPADPAIVAALGSGYDLFISKNVLKMGYVHPRQPLAPEKTLQLGVDDEHFVRAVWALLVPGGKALVYNIYPAQNPPGQEYIPWADGLTPFTRATWERVGFTVLAHDLDDSAAIREQARLLGWDHGEDAMDLSTLFAAYTLVVKPSR